MFKQLRSRLASMVDPDLARKATNAERQMHVAMQNQRNAIAQASALKAKGFKGTVMEYHFWVRWYQNALRDRQNAAMQTLYLPKPSTKHIRNPRERIER
jgi:hypothetical protein